MSIIAAFVPGERGNVRGHSCLQPSIESWSPDQFGSYSHENCTLWAAINWNSPESVGERQPVSHAATGVVVAADCRLDNRGDLIPLLDGLQPGIGDCDLIVAAWLRWGEDCVAHLLGDFAFALWDPRSRTLFAGRDPMGCRPFYFAETKDGIIAASEPGVLIRHPAVSKEISPDWLDNSLAGLADTGGGTPFRGIQRLRPGHSLLFRHGRLRIRQYWRPQPGTLAGVTSEKAIVEQGRHLLSEAVACRLRSAWPLGAELTAGLDSGGVVATAVPLLRARGEEIAVFSRLRAPEYRFIGPDESPGVTLLCDYLGITRRFVSFGSASGLLELLDSSVARHGMPLAPLPLASEEMRVQASSQGIRTMLCGQGGDECFSASEWSLPLQRRSGNWLWRLQHQRALARRQGRGLRSQAAAVALALTPEIAGVLRRRKLPAKSVESPVDKIIASPDLARERRLQELAAARRPSDEPPSSAERLQLQQYPFRLESSALLARQYKQTWVYPLLDRRLLEFALACPPTLRTADGWTRRLSRLILQDRVPHALAWQRSKLQFLIPGAREGVLENATAIKARLDHWRSHSVLSKILDLDRAEKALSRPHTDAVHAWIPRVTSVIDLLQFGNFVLSPNFGEMPLP